MTNDFEIMLYVANKKVKELRDERKELLNIIKGNQIISEKYHHIVNDVFTTAYINNYISTKSERYKPAYAKFIDFVLDSDTIDYVLTHTIHESFDFARNKINGVDNIYSDLVGELNSHLTGLEVQFENQIKDFYRVKSKIILNNPDRFKPVGVHNIKEIYREYDGEMRLIADINAILFQGEKHQFHIMESEYKHNMAGLPYLGRLDGEISSKIEIDCKYNDWSLDQLTKMLNKGK